MTEIHDFRTVVDLIKNGQKAEARTMLITMLEADRDNEQAWLYMAACAQNKKEFETSLQRVLTINPTNGQALKLAQQNKIKIPDAALQAQKASRKAQRQRKQTKGINGLRMLLLMLITALGVAVVVWSYLEDQEDDDALAVPTWISAAPTAEATSEPATSEPPAPTPTDLSVPSWLNAPSEVAEATEEPSAEPTEAITEAPTSTPINNTPEPTNVAADAVATTAPTDTPTATATATITPTATHTPTSTPTDTPEPTATVVEVLPADLVLTYTNDVLYIKNVTADNLDLSDLGFSQTLADGDTQTFLALSWQVGSFTGAGSVYQLQPDSCFQIGTTVALASIKPRDCVRLSSWQQNTSRERFWMNLEGSGETFTVFFGDTVITECPVGEGTCDIALPE